MEPKLAIGDGALGFWKALAKVYGNTRQQRCWVHKTGNVLNCLPKVVQPRAKQALHQIWMAETRQDAYRAFDEFITTYQLEIPKGHGLSRQGSRGVAGLLRFSSRALAPSQDHQPHRVDVCHRQVADRQDSRLSVQANHADDGLQAVPQCTETMASVTGLPPAG